VLLLGTDGENVKILKNAPDASAALSNFSAVITIINYNENHWIALRFLPKKRILEVFDSLEPRNFSHRRMFFKNVSAEPQLASKTFLQSVSD
jgi:hypothetical protein